MSNQPVQLPDIGYAIHLISYVIFVSSNTPFSPNNQNNLIKINILVISPNSPNKENGPDNEK